MVLCKETLDSCRFDTYTLVSGAGNRGSEATTLLSRAHRL